VQKFINNSEESENFIKKSIYTDTDGDHLLDSETDFSKFLLDQKTPNFSKIISFAFLFYLYLTIPVQGNFLFRHKYFKYVILFFSFVFFLFTLRVSPYFYITLIIPVIASLVDVILIKKRDRGINFMYFEVWGILLGCVWIINLMLIMMDILLFLSNIFGVSILLFTCSFIAIGNNIAGTLSG
jgi:hypothetical protein